MADEPLQYWMYGDPPLAGGAETLRAYIRDLRDMNLPEAHPQAADIRADILAAEQRLSEIERASDAVVDPAAA